MNYDHRCWAVVDLDRLEENYRLLRGLLAPGCLYMAVVKANAYGHGDTTLALRLQELGADWFALATVEEAVALRKAGITRPLLVLGYTPPDCAGALAEYGVTQAVFSQGYHQRLATAARQAGVRVRVQVKIDSGMNRLGFHPEDPQALAQVEAVYRDPSFICEGIFTHFAVADETTPEAEQHTLGEYRLFKGFCDRLEDRGVAPGLRHCCNSAGGILHPEMHLEMVRFGIVGYGLPPSHELLEAAPLRPVMELYSRIVLLKEVPPGEGISYGLTDSAPKRRCIATVPIGYADGYSRHLGNIGKALVRGCPVRVVGRVCMDQLMLDVTEVPGVREEDLVTFVGTDGGQTLTFEEMARQAGTISYELTCALSPRVPRIYRQGGTLRE